MVQKSDNVSYLRGGLRENIFSPSVTNVLVIATTISKQRQEKSYFRAKVSSFPKMTDESWVFDSLICFLHSPAWNAALSTFIEEKSFSE